MTDTFEDLNQYATDKQEEKEAKAPKHIVGKLADLLVSSGIDVDEIAHVKRVNVWQGFYKDDEGEAHTVDMAGVAFVPNWAQGPQWPVVQPAAPVKYPTSTVKPTQTLDWETAVVLPDTQIGYRWLRNDVDGRPYLDPFHDEVAIACALSIIRATRPSLVVLLGDFLDLPAQGKYIQEPSWASTTQDAINRGHRLLAEIRSLVPNARIVVLEGNHDLRLPKSIMMNAAASHGLSRANMPESWPVLTVPHLCRFDDLGVEYIAGYPANKFWINENLVCIHGLKVGNASKSAASRVIEDERVSTIFGHVHSMEYRGMTRNVFDGQKQSFAASPGCLCRIDGSVPSVKGGIDVWGRPLTSFENWQQGVAVVTFEPGNGRFSYEQVSIFDGAAIFRGKLYEAGRVTA